MPRPRMTVSPNTPTPLGFGLLPCAVEQLRADPHARMGVQFEPGSGVRGGVVALDALSQAPAGALVPEDYADYEHGYPLVETDPFLIYDGVTAKPIGVTAEDLQKRAKDRLTRTAGHWIERGFLPQLAASTTEKLVTAAVDPDVAIGLLEEWLGDVVGAQGVIHVPRLAIGSLGKHVSASGTRQVTKLGCPVAFGTGYRNVAPAALADGEPSTPAAGEVWVYATGPVQVNRSGVEALAGGPLGGMHYSSNTVTVFAGEVVSVGFEVGVVAVPVKFEIENP